MRRLTGAVLFLAASVCAAGAVIGHNVDGQTLLFPALVFLGMGVYQFSRGRDDDRKSS
jgi:hypothetical protein